MDVLTGGRSIERGDGYRKPARQGLLPYRSCERGFPWGMALHPTS
ncbi:hypothetical protein [Maioricimonas rarisocia]|nr:hypothetical protein [Maioricimonas rarisocia]